MTPAIVERPARSKGDRSAAFAEADACKAVAPAVRAHDDRIAVFEEAARLAGCKRQWAPPPRRDLEQAAQPIVARRRDRAGAEQVSRAQVAAAAAVVRHQLGNGPVEVARVAERQTVRRMPFRREPLREQKYLELDVEGACG